MKTKLQMKKTKALAYRGEPSLIFVRRGRLAGYGLVPTLTTTTPPFYLYHQVLLCFCCFAFVSFFSFDNCIVRTDIFWLLLSHVPRRMNADGGSLAPFPSPSSRSLVSFVALLSLFFLLFAHDIPLGFCCAVSERKDRWVQD
jgi:hypothetical protein